MHFSHSPCAIVKTQELGGHSLLKPRPLPLRFRSSSCQLVSPLHCQRLNAATAPRPHSAEAVGEHPRKKGLRGTCKKSTRYIHVSQPKNGRMAGDIRARIQMWSSMQQQAEEPRQPAPGAKGAAAQIATAGGGAFHTNRVNRNGSTTAASLSPTSNTTSPLSRSRTSSMDSLDSLGSPTRGLASSASRGPAPNRSGALAVATGADRGSLLMMLMDTSGAGAGDAFEIHEDEDMLSKESSRATSMRRLGAERGAPEKADTQVQAMSNLLEQITVERHLELSYLLEAETRRKEEAMEREAERQLERVSFLLHILQEHKQLNASFAQFRMERIVRDHHLALNKIMETESRKFEMSGQPTTLSRTLTASTTASTAVYRRPSSQRSSMPFSGNSNNVAPTSPDSDDAALLLSPTMPWYSPAFSASSVSDVHDSRSTTVHKLSEDTPFTPMDQAEFFATQHGEHASFPPRQVLVDESVLKNMVLELESLRAMQHAQQMQPPMQPLIAPPRQHSTNAVTAASRSVPNSRPTTLDRPSTPKSDDQAFIDHVLLLSYANDLTVLAEDSMEVTRRLRTTRNPSHNQPTPDLSSAGAGQGPAHSFLLQFHGQQQQHRRTPSQTSMASVPSSISDFIVLDDPMDPSTLIQRFTRHIGSLKVALERASTYERRLSETEARLRARDEYLQNTIMDTARRVQELEGHVAELEMTNEELTMELKRARMEGDRVREELEDMESDHLALQNQLATVGMGMGSELAREVDAVAQRRRVSAALSGGGEGDDEEFVLLRDIETQTEEVAVIPHLAIGRELTRHVSSSTLGSKVSSFTNTDTDATAAGVGAGSVRSWGGSEGGKRVVEKSVAAKEVVSASALLSLGVQLTYAHTILATQAETIAALEARLAARDIELDRLASLSARASVSAEHTEAMGQTKDRVIDELSRRVNGLEAEIISTGIRLRAPADAPTPPPASPLAPRRRPTARAAPQNEDINLPNIDTTLRTILDTINPRPSMLPSPQPTSSSNPPRLSSRPTSILPSNLPPAPFRTNSLRHLQQLNALAPATSDALDEPNVVSPAVAFDTPSPASTVIMTPQTVMMTPQTGNPMTPRSGSTPDVARASFLFLAHAPPPPSPILTHAAAAAFANSQQQQQQQQQQGQQQGPARRSVMVANPHMVVPSPVAQAPMQGSLSVMTGALPPAGFAAASGQRRPSLTSVGGPPMMISGRSPVPPPASVIQMMMGGPASMSPKGPPPTAPLPSRPGGPIGPPPTRELPPPPPGGRDARGPDRYAGPY
ncbi:hypothetical protein HK101_004543 [Irineochytrium annulatum]|nr:hypothetical protein HK101_004543 [Irineochytrium annulatum]